MTRDLAPTSDLLERLRAGATPAQVRQALNLSPVEFVAALGQAALGSDDPADWPPLIQVRPRRPWLAQVLGEQTWADLFPSSARPALLALAAGLLQIHDFWDASHEAAQQADNLGERGFSAYWHGIAHRREPDAGNAAYWFRRVGRHPLFTRLWDEALPLLEGQGEGQPAGLLLQGGAWNPMAFIDLCTSARAGSDRALLALRLQRLEMRALLDATTRAV